MQISILGYGKMGKEIEKVAQERGHVIACIIDCERDYIKNEFLFKQSDVAVEFSTPETVLANIKRCFSVKIPIVVGTTGWYSQLAMIKEEVQLQQQSMFFASNFSLGVNIFFEINKKLAELISKYADYQPTIDEIHHTEKLDAPSGTAITLANQIITSSNIKTKWVNHKSDNPEDLVVLSQRVGSVPGTHIIKYESEIDKIQIKHEAKNRKGFALGAILAAEFIHGKKGFFEMKDLLFKNY